MFQASELQRRTTMGKDALYLKYRPFQLEDIVGQKYVVATLKAASQQNKFAHSYIFGGTKGAGKTTSARILANLLTCENVKEGRLCGKCRACTTIHNGFSTDVVELDGAAKRSVDDIQQLIEAARYSPHELKRKIFIIDECHQLSNTAISALLKIVEEPPEYLTFVFCTTEVNKIPDTILSRSQRFNFAKIASKEAVARLQFIATNEKIDITSDAMFELAKLGRGSMRDAIGYLEQMATIASGKQITDKHVQKYFGASDRKVIFDIISAMMNQNYSLLMDQSNDMVMASADIKSILYEISEVFRSIMVVKAQNGDSRNLDLPDTEIQKIKEMGTSLKLSQIDQLCRAFSSVNREIEFSINDRWVLESTFIRCASLLKKET